MPHNFHFQQHSELPLKITWFFLRKRNINWIVKAHTSVFVFLTIQYSPFFSVIKEKIGQTDSELNIHVQRSPLFESVRIHTLGSRNQYSQNSQHRSHHSKQCHVGYKSARSTKHMNHDNQESSRGVQFVGSRVRIQFFSCHLFI